MCISKSAARVQFLKILKNSNRNKTINRLVVAGHHDRMGGDDSQAATGDR